MNKNDKDYELIKNIVEVTDSTDKYVVLKEDGQGKYIEYAFKEGAPHDNRCLSWYITLQPEALKRNGHDEEYWKSLHLDRYEIGEIYYLSAFTCGKENEDGDYHCSPGHPCKKCVEQGYAQHWTYKEPVKCACWSLSKVNFDTDKFIFDKNQIKMLLNCGKRN